MFREIKEAYNTECKEGTYRIANQNLGGTKRMASQKIEKNVKEKDYCLSEPRLELGTFSV